MITVDESIDALKFPHAMNYEKRAEISDLIAAMSVAVKSNHEWHKATDEYGGYDDSELYDTNVMFLRGDDDAR